ncbi:MAG: ABC transporter ATP-binding protein, partial [Halanaeroarchaeum sp.]
MIPDVLTDLLATVGAESPDPERGPGSGAVGVEDVSVTLGGQTILEDVSLTVEAGTFVGLIGPNGSGKTTLLRTMSAILAPESGRVRVSGTDVRGLSSRAVSQRVAVVPQDTHLAFDFDVRDVVAMGRTPYRPRISFGQRPDEATVDDAMERAQVDHLADRSIDAVSGGERQRVLLARALAQDTPVLLLDEPTASLDINHQIRTLEIVRSLVEDSANLRFAENPSGSDAR